MQEKQPALALIDYIRRLRFLHGHGYKLIDLTVVVLFENQHSGTQSQNGLYAYNLHSTPSSLLTKLLPAFSVFFYVYSGRCVYYSVPRVILELANLS